MRPVIALITLLSALSCLTAAEPSAAGIYERPFSADSPWNIPIPANASFAPIAGIGSFNGSLNHDGRWSTGISFATGADRSAHLYIHPPELWSLLNAGTVLTAGNPSAIEDDLRTASSDAIPFAANYYSTTIRSPPGSRTWPTGIRGISTAWRNTIRVPTGAAPSPDSDGHLAIMQPDGLMLECYDAVVCANGDVICTMASFSDPAGDGTGRGNGRTASLIPNYAGKIRKGEISSGRIPHALCCTASPTLLAAAAVNPAYAFDTNDGYSGTLPMGTLLAIPPTVDIDALGLSSRGRIIAAAAVEYGIYIIDRGGVGGIGFQAALDADDASYPEAATDATRIVRQLHAVTAPATIVSGPHNRSVTVGGTATFAVTATALPTPFYQWTRNGMAIDGATAAAYTTPPTVLGDHGAVFAVVLSGPAGSATSAGAVLAVTAAEDDGGTGDSTAAPSGSSSGGCGLGSAAGLAIAALWLVASRRRGR